MVIACYWKKKVTRAVAQSVTELGITHPAALFSFDETRFDF